MNSQDIFSALGLDASGLVSRKSLTSQERGCLVITGCTVIVPYEEMAELEQIIRKARREKEQAQKPSLGDTDPVSVGTILKPIRTREEWNSEMLTK